MSFSIAEEESEEIRGILDHIDILNNNINIIQNQLQSITSELSRSKLIKYCKLILKETNKIEKRVKYMMSDLKST